MAEVGAVQLHHELIIVVIIVEQDLPIELVSLHLYGEERGISQRLSSRDCLRLAYDQLGELFFWYVLEGDHVPLTVKDCVQLFLRQLVVLCLLEFAPEYLEASLHSWNMARVDT